MRSRETIEAQKSQTRPKLMQDLLGPRIESMIEDLRTEQQPKQRKQRGNPENIKPFCWKPGQSGNPGGRPKRDLASELCQAVFENHPDEIYGGIRKLLKSGSAFGFQVAADRGFGKLKESMDVHMNGSLAERLEKIRKRKNGRKASDE